MLPCALLQWRRPLVQWLWSFWAGSGPISEYLDAKMAQAPDRSFWNVHGLRRSGDRCWHPCGNAGLHHWLPAADWPSSEHRRLFRSQQQRILSQQTGGGSWARGHDAGCNVYIPRRGLISTTAPSGPQISIHAEPRGQRAWLKHCLSASHPDSGFWVGVELVQSSFLGAFGELTSWWDTSLSNILLIKLSIKNVRKKKP